LHEFDVELSTDVNIYPNPSNGNLTITNVENSNIQILDINGRVVYNSSSNSCNQNLDLSFLEKGTYIAKIYNNSSVTVKKIVLN